MTVSAGTATRDVMIPFRVTTAEARELRLLARAEGISTSEAIRRALRQRAEAIANGSAAELGCAEVES